MTRLAQLELLDADGRVQQAWDIAAWPLTLGRALDNHVVLHDPHAAAHHATVELDAEGRPLLRALSSRNGLRIDQGHSLLSLSGGQSALLPPLATWHLGASTLRLRRAEDPLPDELPLTAQPQPAGASRKPVLALAAALLAWTLGALWLANNPASTWEAYLPPLLALGGGLLAWAALWGLASKLFTRRFAMLAHLHVVLMYALAIGVAEPALGLLAAAADWPWASRIGDLVGWALVAAMLAHHLRLVVPAHPRRINAVAAVLAVLMIGGLMALHWQRNDRWFEEQYVATLPPPSWRLAPARPVSSLIEDLRGVEEVLVERARKAVEKDLDL
jgi:FHA domain